MSVIGRVLAIDYGLARVGLALSDPLGIAIEPLQNLERIGDKHLCRDIAALVEAEEVAEVVVGLPTDMGGNDSKQTGLVRSFAERLTRYVRVPVELWDERLTTVAAERLLTEAGMSRKKQKKSIDGAAATLILQGYLASKSFGSYDY